MAVVLLLSGFFSLPFTLMIQNHFFLGRKCYNMYMSCYGSTYIKLQLNPEQHEGWGSTPPTVEN